MKLTMLFMIHDVFRLPIWCQGGVIQVFRQGLFLIRVIVLHFKYVLGRAITQDLSKG